MEAGVIATVVVANPVAVVDVGDVGVAFVIGEVVVVGGARGSVEGCWTMGRRRAYVATATTTLMMLGYGGYGG